MSDAPSFTVSVTVYVPGSSVTFALTTPLATTLPPVAFAVPPPSFANTAETKLTATPTFAKNRTAVAPLATVTFPSPPSVYASAFLGWMDATITLFTVDSQYFPPTLSGTPILTSHLASPVAAPVYATVHWCFVPLGIPAAPNVTPAGIGGVEATSST